MFVELIRRHRAMRTARRLAVKQAAREAARLASRAALERLDPSLPRTEFEARLAVFEAAHARWVALLRS